MAWISAIAAILTLTGAAYSMQMIIELDRRVQVLDHRDWDLMRDMGKLEIECKTQEYSIKEFNNKLLYTQGVMRANHK